MELVCATEMSVLRGISCMQEELTEWLAICALHALYAICSGHEAIEAAGEVDLRAGVQAPSLAGEQRMPLHMALAPQHAGQHSANFSAGMIVLAHYLQGLQLKLRVPCAFKACVTQALHASQGHLHHQIATSMPMPIPGQGC